MERIDVSGPPDGTVVETNLGHLYHTDRGGFQNARRDIGDGNPLAWNADHYPVRAYEPLPTPDQEVPRDGWGTLPGGAMIRVETDYGVIVGTVRNRTSNAILIGSIGARHVVSFHGITRLYRLDTPHDRTPADVIGADQVAALEAAGWAITRAER